jgi:hypothetical protein
LDGNGMSCARRFRKGRSGEPEAQYHRRDHNGPLP